MYRLNVLFSSCRLLKGQCLIDRYLRSLGKLQQQNFCQSVIKKDPNDFVVQETEDLNISYQELNAPKDLKMVRLIDLGLKKTVTTISKPGSFTGELFLGKIDTDFLYYPKLIYSRKEYMQLYLQNIKIQHSFRDVICEKDGINQLKELGFMNLWKMSMTEKCSIFESIGISMIEDVLFKQLLNPNAKDLENTKVMKIFDSEYINQFIKLLLHNLTGSCLMFADPQKEISKKYIDLMTDYDSRLGFAFNETEKKLGSLPFSDWNTVAELSEDKSYWTVRGEKNKILDGKYDHYIVFARTKDYPKDEKSNYKRKYDEPYDGVVCLVIDRKDVKVVPDEVNNCDDPQFNYQKVEFDNLKVARERELFEAEEYGCAGLSCRGIGLLMTTSYQLGILKSLQRQVYKFLLQNKSEFLDCKSVRGQLTDMTEIIYEIESMNYLIAAMYDSFDLKSFPDMTLETSILKSFTTEKSRQFLVKIQTLFGSKLMGTSKFHDIVNLYDSLFDSGMHHRIFTASLGSHMVGVYNVNDVIKYNLPLIYPSFMLWKKWTLRKNELDNPLLEHDVSGNLHVKLTDEGDKLEYCLKSLEYGAMLAVDKFKKELNNEQMVLLDLGDLVSNVFALTCTLSRASRADIEGVQNSDNEIFLARNITRQHVHQVKFLVEKLQDITFKEYELDETMYNDQVHKKNLKFNGYFPYPPIEQTY